MKIISVAKDFSVTPGGRYNRDGAYSGEAFRTRFLEPLLDSEESTVVNLDGVAGLPSSFLEEAFGGIFRTRKGLDLAKARRLIRVEATQPEVKPYLLLVERYMHEASKRS